MRSVLRSEYLNRLSAGRDDNSTVKVITGMRRSGKSVLLKQYAQLLMESGTDRGDIISIDFERKENQWIADKDALNRWISENVPDDRQCYVLLDEIQNVKDWEMSVSALQAMGNCDVYITGSNSKMLSSELATHISGRYMEVGILPLSFKEYLELNPSEDIESRFSDYIELGSLPVIDPDGDRQYNEGILEGVFNTVLVKDILSRLTTNDVTKLTDIVRFLYSNIGNLTNPNRIADETGISDPTVRKFIDEMEKAFLFYYAERYDIVGKKLLKNTGKYYATDLGMRNVLLGSPQMKDVGRLLENVVFLELIRRGYKVHVGSFRDSEIDFTAIRSGRTEYFQVAKTIMSDDTYDREMRPLNGVRDNCPKTVLTMDRIGLGSDNGIDIRNLVDWLLERTPYHHGRSNSVNSTSSPSTSKRPILAPQSSHPWA